MEDILTSWSEGLELSLKLHLNLGTGVTNSHADMNNQCERRKTVILIYLFLYFGLQFWDGLVREILNLPLNLKKENAADM